MKAENFGAGLLAFGVALGAALGVSSSIFRYFVSFIGGQYASVEAEYVEGFYGKGYVAVLYGLYEYNPYKCEAYPNPMILVIAGLIALTGLILYAASKRPPLSKLKGGP